MKSSLAKTLAEYKAGENTCDVFFSKRTTVRNITVDNRAFSSANLAIVDNDDYNLDEKMITSLLVKPELKKEYDNLYIVLNEQYDVIKKLIKTQSGVELPIMLKDLNINGLNDVTADLFNSSLINENFQNIKYAKFFSDDNMNILKKPEVINGIQNYIDISNEVIKDSNILTQNIFDLYHLKKIISEAEKNNYFEVGHLLKCKLTNADGYKDFNKDDIEKLVTDLEEKLKSSDEVKKAYSELNSKVKSHELNTILFQNQWIIPLLKDIEDLKKQYWIYIVNLDNIKYEITKYVDLFNENKDEINKLIKESNKEENLDKWKNAVNKFNSKFINMPFKLEIMNISDVVLKGNACVLNFVYADGRETNRNVDRDILYSNLSRGERRAFNILSLIFEIEYRIENKIETIIILDDIADSFDYKNKYAIIEFLKELNDNPLFHLILMTHNFDFYRSCANRLKIKTLSVIKNAGSIELVDFNYKKNIFTYFRNNINDKKFFIASIPFVRNIIEMTDKDFQNNGDYLLLTSCLHYKNDTNIRTTDDINKIFSNLNMSSNIQNQNYFQLVINVANNISNSNPIELENKIVLSIAIRLLFEEKLADKLDSANIPHNFDSNQTYKLIDACKYHNLLNDKEIMISDKVLIMVSENIHVNAFMYEPIIDMSDEELLNLYDEVKRLK